MSKHTLKQSDRKLIGATLNRIRLLFGMVEGHFGYMVVDSTKGLTIEDWEFKKIKVKNKDIDMKKLRADVKRVSKDLTKLEELIENKKDKKLLEMLFFL